MRRLVLLAVLLVACKKADKPKPGAVTKKTDACAKATEHEGAMAWMHDDYPAALACAQQKHVPIVIDLWAPWCHTCLSMQTTVFTDPSFKAEADKFVFLGLDTDRDNNAPVLDKFPVSAWPTFYVVSPDEKVLARFVGGASVAQFHAFLDTGARSMTGGTSGPDVRLLAAERALSTKDYATADTELTAAVEGAPEGWVRKPDALVSLISTKARRKDWPGCMDVAEKYMDATGNTASASDFMYSAMECATSAAKDNPDRVKALREKAVTRWKALLDDKTSPMSVDDRSDAMANLRETLIALDKKDEAKQVAEAQRTLLDETAAKAPTPIAAMTYNWPRAEVYVYLERPLDLVPALEKSAADLPKEYDPPARLGWIYLKAGKYDEAAKWVDKSLALVYGPRRARVLGYRAEIAQKLGDKAGEKKWKEEIVKTLEALPPNQTTPEAIAKAKQAVLDVDNPPVTSPAPK